jgi:hypothetical protein
MKDDFVYDLMAYGLLITMWALSYVENIDTNMSCPLNWPGECNRDITDFLLVPGVMCLL